MQCYVLLPPALQAYNFSYNYRITNQLVFNIIFLCFCVRAVSAPSFLCVCANESIFVFIVNKLICDWVWVFEGNLPNEQSVQLIGCEYFIVLVHQQRQTEWNIFQMLPPPLFWFWQFLLQNSSFLSLSSSCFFFFLICLFFDPVRCVSVSLSPIKSNIRCLKP